MPEPSSRPYVVAHVAVSIDGATVGFDPDVARFYELARTWDEDVTLTGADTILAQERALRDAPRPGPAVNAPLLAVVDSRARVREWQALRDVGHWSAVLALRCRDSRASPADAAEQLVVGVERVDLGQALDALGTRPGVRTVRVDSGGGLVGPLLDRGLVDEVSLLVHPVLVGDASAPRWYGNGTRAPTEAHLAEARTLDRLLWLRYRLHPSPGRQDGPGPRADRGARGE
jgi:2,5-diamino-6-(ribosylamino)-4(3H)-pyrimidinone 5'-phosphate reductase